MNKFISLIKVEENSLSCDFNGPCSSTSLNSQLEYLHKYFYVAKEEYGFNENKRVVEEGEINELLSKIPYEHFGFRNRTYLGDGLSTLLNLETYKHITLFNGATVSSNTIIMKEVNHNPLPSFEIECVEFKSIKFQLFLDKKYKSPLRGGVDTMVPHRNIEFKNGLDIVLKMAIYSDGTIYLKTKGNDIYHFNHLYLGRYEFDKANYLSIAFSDTNATIKLNDETKTVELLTNKFPNMMFAGSGLHARFMWSVTIDEVIDVSNCKIDIFRLNNDNYATYNSFNVTLPFVFGTYQNRHLSSIFLKEFNVNVLNKNYILNIEEIGPNGSIYINDKKVIDIDDLCFTSIDITKYINSGINNIKVIINPQAPENVISWHRNADPYFGSYLGNIYIDEVNSSHFSSVRINTSNIVDNEIFVKSIYDIKGTYSSIRTLIYDLNHNLIYETNNAEFSFFGSPWSFDNPQLYRIIYQLISDSVVVDEYEIITGFRTVKQRDGKILINNKEEILKGALLMQYLYPYNDIALNHVMPSNSQLAEQVIQAKKMSSNCLRMHQLGYGCNDYRLARMCDYLGISTIWVTRYIDTAFGITYDGKWHQKSKYQKQMLRLINSPSIIMWEGANEYYLYREDIDSIFNEFVNGIKEIDTSRLISPISHLYYANDSYNKNCQYYQDSGKEDEFFNQTNAVEEWNDPLVVRSAHTYAWLLGYGSTWNSLREQSWSAQGALLNSNNHAYLVSEYAIIGRQNPNIKETKLFFNNNSYEYQDELVNGYIFDDDKWYLSQAYQSLAATYATRKMLALGVDGLLWCSLNGGANDASYLKPIIDFYGYPKLAFFALKNCFDKITTFLDDVDVIWNKSHNFNPIVITNLDNKKYDIKYYIKDADNNVVFEICYKNIIFDKKIIRLNHSTINNLKNGYYKLYSVINESEELPL